MKPRNKVVASVTLLFLTLAMGQLYVPVSFAQTSQMTAILTTGNNQPVNVNGASTISGATIMSGAAIETPDQVGASLSLPNHFTLDIAPRASVTVTFAQNSIIVNVIKGCVVLHTKQGTTGEIITGQKSEKADGSKDARLDNCDSSPAGGLSTGATIAIIGALVGALALIPILKGGSNPSSFAP